MPRPSLRRHVQNNAARHRRHRVRPPYVYVWRRSDIRRQDGVAVWTGAPATSRVLTASLYRVALAGWPPVCVR
eukprot:814626-Prymnesium_polylepis.1